MNKVKHLFSGVLALLAVLLLTGCGEKENPTRTSLELDTSTLTLLIGESAFRTATTKAEHYKITYTSSNPTVATVDRMGKVTGMSAGQAVITVEMAESIVDWYAPKKLTYNVVVKDITAKDLPSKDKATPLTLVAQADGKITVNFNNGITLANDICYTINGGAEQTIPKNTTGAYDIAVKKGDVVQLYSTNSSLGGGAAAGARGGTRAVADGAKYINIRPSMKTEIYGNVMSLLKGKDAFVNADAIEANNAFYGLFAGAVNLVNSAERQLILPALTLKEGCYQDMFYDCKGIEKAPVLPAPELTKNCYAEMFAGCSKLSYVACLAIDTSAEGSTKGWLSNAGTEATGQKVIDLLTPLSTSSDDGVPQGWTGRMIISVTDIKLDKTEVKMSEIGANVTLTATITPDYALDKSVEWISSNPAVATVDANGKVTAVGSGTATITAQATDNTTIVTGQPYKTATCTVTVYVPVERVTINGAEDIATKISDNKDNSGQLTATITPATATDQTVTWKSSHPNILAVDANGRVTLKGYPAEETTVKITATSNANATATAIAEIGVIADPGVALSDASVGMIIAGNGKAYTKGNYNQVCGAKVAVIAYMGEGSSADKSENSSDYFGLAIALTDASSSKLAWGPRYVHCVSWNPDYRIALDPNTDANGFGKGIDNTNKLANATCGSGHNHPAAKAALDYESTVPHPAGTSQWFLPTMYQWNLMVKGMCGDHGNLVCNTSAPNDNYKAATFNEKIIAAGGVGVKSSSYWSSVEYNSERSWMMFFNYGIMYHFRKTDTDCYVRAVLAF